MWKRSRPWSGGFTASPSFRFRLPSRSKPRSAAPRLEHLESRTLLSAGDLDPTFGMGGELTNSFQGPLDSQAQAAALQPDGKIVEVGGATNGFAGGFGVVRFNADGSLDPSFGKDGTVNTAFPGAACLDRATAVAIQGDGRIVVAGIDNF